jgi:hypothetical protein
VIADVLASHRFFVVLVLSETVLVLDGCLICGDTDRRSRRLAVTCGQMGRIAILDHVEYQYRSPWRTTGYRRGDFDVNN